MNEAELSFVITVGIIVAFYVIFIRPTQKDQSRHRQQIRDLRPGDEVLTTAGFIAKVKDIQVPESGPTRIYLELTDGVVVTALTSAIQQRITPLRQAQDTAMAETALPGESATAGESQPSGQSSVTP